MKRFKSVISIILLCSLFISTTGFISGVYDEEVIDLTHECDDKIACCDGSIVVSDYDDSTVFSASQDPVVQFVERLYDLVLQRQPDPGGLQGWTDYLKSGAYTGAGVAYGFFFSQEMNARNLSADRFIEILYQTFLNRPFDQAGKDGWLAYYNSGYSKEDLFAGFANSNEFGNLCAQAGIVRGTYNPPPGRDIRVFVTRLYRTTLLREPDVAGLNGWTNLLLNGTTGVSVAHGFVFSNEMRARNLTNAQFIDILYTAFLGRAADAPGRTFWVGQLDDGLPREDVFAGFANSNEFGNISSAAGIVRGTYIPPPGGALRAFINRLFRTTQGINPGPGQADHWYGLLNNGSETGASFAYSLVFSPEMTARNLSNDRFVEVLFTVMMNRQSTVSDRAVWVTQLNNGVSRYSIFTAFVDSSEFAALCATLGIQKGTAPLPINSLPGTTMVSRVWNLITAAQFTGISDRPEHIAGIIGNLQSEAGLALCPFQQQVSNQVGIGLMQWSFGRRIAVENYMWLNGISPDEFFAEVNKHLTSVCNNPQHIHPPELLDQVLTLQINFMFHELRNTSERLYMNFVDYPSEKQGFTGVRAYAELFCALALRPGPGVGEINNIQDEGVLLALQASPYSGGVGNLERISYSALETRRNRAVVVYQQYLVNHS